MHTWETVLMQSLCYSGKWVETKDREMSFVNIPTHPPLYCKEEEFEGFGLWKEEVQNFVLKSQLSHLGIECEVMRHASEMKWRLTVQNFSMCCVYLSSEWRPIVHTIETLQHCIRRSCSFRVRSRLWFRSVLGRSALPTSHWSGLRFSDHC